MKGQLPTFQNNFSLFGPFLVRSSVRPPRRCCCTKSFDDLYVHVTIIGFSAKCGEKGEVCSSGKLLKLGLDAKKNYYLLSITYT